MTKYYAIHWGQENHLFGIWYVGEFGDTGDDEDKLEELREKCNEEVGSFEHVQIISKESLQKLIDDLTTEFQEAQKEEPS